MDSLPSPAEVENLRARKAGIARRLQKQTEERYDIEESIGTPQRVMEWLNATLSDEHQTCSGSSWKRLQFYLRDGIALCKLINKLRVASGLTPVKFQMNVVSSFFALENIELFNKAAEEYGLAREATFQSGDLFEGQKGPFLNVINCLNKLGFVANQKGFTPEYEAVLPPERDADLWAGK